MSADKTTAGEDAAEDIEIEGFPPIRENPVVRNVAQVPQREWTRAGTGLDLDKLTFSAVWNSMTLAHVAGVVATVVTVVGALIGLSWTLGGERVRYDADKSVHEVLERERDEQAAARTCQYDLNAATRQIEQQQRQCVLDRTKVELESATEQSKAYARDHKHGK